MRRHDAKRIQSQLPLYEQVHKLVSAVDVYSMLMNHLRKAPKMRDSCAGIASAFGRYLIELGMRSFEEYEGAVELLCTTDQWW